MEIPTQPIYDVSLSTKDYIEQKYGPWPFLTVGAFIVLEVFFLYYLFTLHNGAFDFRLVYGAIFIPIVVLGALYSSVTKKMRDAFMEQFAAANGYTFEAKGNPGGQDGVMFSLGHSRNMEDVITGQFQNHPVQLFNYSYSVGSGKSEVTYQHTVFDTNFNSKLPDILLYSKNNQTGEALSAAGVREVKLEGDFNQHFRLWVPPGFEIEALEIVAPDFMAALEDRWPEFTLELTSGHLYVYAARYLDTAAELKSMYELVQYLIEKIEPVLARMEHRQATIAEVRPET